MLDTVTLRVAFGLTAFCVIVLFYLGGFRSTRSAFAGWWVLSLVGFLASSLLFLCNGTSVQFLANPIGNAVAVSGAACVWVAACSLREWRPPSGWLVGPPIVVLVLSLIDDPAHDIWAGGVYFLLAMSGYFALGTRELWRLWRERTMLERADQAYAATILSMWLASGAMAVFYLLRAVALTAVGADSAFFRDFFGGQTTTLFLMVLLIAVTYNMSTLSQLRRLRELRRAADEDPLTGLLNRAGFRRYVTEYLRESRRVRRAGFLVMADVDDFKGLNDRFGHAAGDAALSTFGHACRDAVALIDGAVAARLGGDEFVLLLPELPGVDPEQVARTINGRLAEVERLDGLPLPSVSYGIASLEVAAGWEAVLVRADAALYRAKANGRGRIERVVTGAVGDVGNMRDAS